MPRTRGSTRDHREPPACVPTAWTTKCSTRGRTACRSPSATAAGLEATCRLVSVPAPAFDQKSGVVAMLEKLRHKFQDQLLDLQKAEMNAKSNFQALAQGLQDNIEYDTGSSKAKTASRAGRLEDAAKAKGDLEVTTKTKADDEKILLDTNTECDAKSKEFEENQVLRREELQAIAKAREILASPEVTGNAAKYLPKLVQKAVALAQLGSKASKDADNRKRAAAYLQQKAKKLGSQYLSMMALRVTEDPFGKVKKMIKDLIVKLMESANAEADHNAFCSTELATNKQTRENKASKAEDGPGGHRRQAHRRHRAARRGDHQAGRRHRQYHGGAGRGDQAPRR
ncbi:unnamed protein product [Prorocentrum cordatum]|uniref:Uncharacterized protein n=1 Tax=Prorocentrum cordatum TaxID=2364126 RepID=A0ABN9RJW2_9DINO|nr:unnamed protein product [Polarella glacialis]